jgi:hypothetical protein
MWVGSLVRVYIPGRSRTGCNPFRTRIDDSAYLPFATVVLLRFSVPVEGLTSNGSGMIVHALQHP